jgi:hypothetical protein
MVRMNASFIVLFTLTHVLLWGREAWYFKVEQGGFQVSRGSQGKKDMIATSQSDVTNAVSSFVRSVVAMGSAFQPLPQERSITMRLYYDPENPPPPGFNPSDDFISCEDSLSWPAKPECHPMGTDYMTVCTCSSFFLDVILHVSRVRAALFFVS